MASTYTANSGIELIATGEQSGAWGDTTNINLQIVDRLTNGVGAITLSGTTHTLSTTNGALSDGQYKVLVFGGTPSGTNTVTVSPNTQDKVFFVKNSSGQSVVITQGSGGDVTVANGTSSIIYCDGAGAGAAVVDITATFSGFLFAANNLSDVANAATARTNLGLGTGDSPAFTAVTAGQVDITAQGDLRLQDTTGGEYVALQAPTTVSASYTLTLPAADGTSGQALITNGAGALTFGAAGISTGKAIAMAIVFG
jgi:hypothetical protein